MGIQNISKSLLNLNDNEKVITTSYTLGGEQECLYLTENGLYRFLGQSRKPIAKTFQSWMTDVIKEIRLTGMYRLKQENEVDKQLLKNKQSKNES